MPQKPFEDPTFDDPAVVGSGGTSPQPAPRASAADQDFQAIEAELLATPGVKGVGRTSDSLGQAALEVYVLDDSVARRLPKTIRAFTIVPKVTGEIDALKSRRRPDPK